MMGDKSNSISKDKRFEEKTIDMKVVVVLEMVLEVVWEEVLVVVTEDVMVVAMGGW